MFGEVLRHSVDFADLYFQLSREESWALEDGIVKDGSASIEQGVGVRAVAGEKTGFAYSDEIVLPALEEASRAARAIAARGGDRRVQAWRRTTGHSLYLPDRPGVELQRSSEKVALARARRSRGAQARSARRAGHGERRRGARGGADRPQRRHLAADVRPLVRFNVTVIVEQNGRREQGYAGGGGRSRCAELVTDDQPLAARARGGAPGAGQPRSACPRPPAR